MVAHPTNIGLNSGGDAVHRIREIAIRGGENIVQARDFRRCDRIVHRRQKHRNEPFVESAGEMHLPRTDLGSH